MGRKSKYSSNQKLEIVLKALQAKNTSVVARKYEVSVPLVLTWKKELLNSADSIFENSADKQVKKLQKQIAKLEQIIGQKEVEINLVKNFVDFYKSPDGN